MRSATRSGPPWLMSMEGGKLDATRHSSRGPLMTPVPLWDTAVDGPSDAQAVRAPAPVILLARA